jgi:hypothetical protein
MRFPRIDPVGRLEIRDGFRARPRPRTWKVRLAALLVLVAFVAVGVATTAVSLGAYCLTTDTADTRSLPGFGAPQPAAVELSGPSSAREARGAPRAGGR